MRERPSEIGALTGHANPIVAAACAIGLAFGLKAFYSSAGAEQLLWILAPSSWLARFVGGIDLTYEPGAGFISHTYRMVVGASCAGLNFLVICFLAVYFSFARHSPDRFRWLLWSAIVSFAATVAANALRIFVTAHLWNAEIYGEWMTPEQMHRLAGTAIYYGSLVLVYVTVESEIGQRSHRAAPLLWYLGVTLGVPLIGRMVVDGSSEFVEHATWVAGVAAVLTLPRLLPWILRNRVFWKA